MRMSCTLFLLKILPLRQVSFNCFIFSLECSSTQITCNIPKNNDLFLLQISAFSVFAENRNKIGCRISSGFSPISTVKKASLFFGFHSSKPAYWTSLICIPLSSSTATKLLLLQLILRKIYEKNKMQFEIFPEKKRL